MSSVGDAYLVKHSKDNRWQNREEDIVESEGPRLKENLTRERV